MEKQAAGIEERSVSHKEWIPKSFMKGWGEAE